MASKKPTEVNPAALFKAAIAKSPAENGYKSEFVEGSDGRLKIVQAPDGHYFADWGNGGNPKNNVRMVDVNKARAFVKDSQLFLAAVEIADELNKDKPTSHIASKAATINKGISVLKK